MRKTHPSRKRQSRGAGFSVKLVEYERRLSRLYAGPFMEERLQKIMARAGIASRRHAEEMIVSGLVSVNGRVVTELGTKADEARDHIKVSGKLLRPEKDRVYLILHKPPEVVATMSDPEGRPSLRDFLHGVPERVFPVGRLEYHASGLLLLTNDGDLANRILKAHHLPQRYYLKLKSLLSFAEIEELSRSTRAKIRRRERTEAPWYEVTLSEARGDALRNKLFQTGHPVEKLKRVAIADLELGSLAPGQYRALTGKEVASLFRSLSPVGSSMRPVTYPRPKRRHRAARHKSGVKSSPGKSR